MFSGPVSFYFTGLWKKKKKMIASTVDGIKKVRYLIPPAAKKAGPESFEARALIERRIRNKQ